MRTEHASVTSRNDYRPYPYAVSQVRLCFDLDHDTTRVHAELDITRRCAQPQPLVLNGQDLDLISITLDGQTLNHHQYDLQHDVLTLNPTASSFTLTITSECRPAENTALMGLYASGKNLFTQCEAEGFRRIMWFPDRPDVMTLYRVTLRADKVDYPVLLSNGNLISQRNLPDGRHEAVWDDPYPKPSYLFALVAGDFGCREKTVKTRSGRPVSLQVYSDKEDVNKTEWALDCLERAMRWDEDTFGLELDLDRFMIVAARDFNMGAMENKGLNIFNSAYVLASKDSATDATYRTIEAVIGHEYFHNWTGNRITCRDWFQLSLKEGLTVFREQAFSEDMLAHGLNGAAADNARAVKRIEDVNILRNNQFPEDAGPMAHPIRPESYHEISNFYTSTIYEKGAEVIRMLHTLLTPQGFRQGMEEYVRRHDGQAVTCDAFLDAMDMIYQQRNPGKSLDVFRRWYSQAGTPRLTLTTTYDHAKQRCTLTLRQQNEHAGIEKQELHAKPKDPLHIPVSIGFLNADGTSMASPYDGTVTLELTDTTQSWSFDDMKSPPVISRLRSFSAPVIINGPDTNTERMILAKHDPDPFARWEAIQEFASHAILTSLDPDAPNATASAALNEDIVEIWRSVIEDSSLTAAYRAQALTLISQKQLFSKVDLIDPLAINDAHARIHTLLGTALAKQWHNVYVENSDIDTQTYRPHPTDAGKRTLRSLALNYLLAGDHEHALHLASTQYIQANNLTDRLGALSALTRHAPQSASADLLSDFYDRGRHDAQIMDSWFSVQASAHWARVHTIEELMQHPAFSIRNPNRVRALIFQFCLNNYAAVHNAQGYTYWARQILALDALNPEIAARLARGLDNWAHFIEPARTGMRHILETIRHHNSLSPHVSEVVDKALTI